MNSINELWQNILEKDDRTSPAEYPDMALITFEEFTDAIQAASAFTPWSPTGAWRHAARRWNKTEILVLQIQETQPRGPMMARRWRDATTTDFTINKNPEKT